MPRKKYIVELTKSELFKVISALRDTAHTLAGSSQAPHLIRDEDTDEHRLAVRLSVQYREIGK